MESQNNSNLGQEEPPAQLNNVMVDLVHPQEIPTTAPPPPPSAPIAPVAPPPSVAPVVQPPTAPAPVVAQIGTTQLPRARKPFPAKSVAIVLGILLLLGAGGTGAYIFLKPKPAPVASAPVQVESGPVSNLVQSNSSGALLTAGAATNQKSIDLTFSFATSANRGSVLPQVEIQPLDVPFTNEVTASGNLVPANGSTLRLAVKAGELKDGSYHWQARVVVDQKAGEWKSFEGTGPSFIVDTIAPTAPVVAKVGSIKVSSGSVKVSEAKPSFSGTAEPGSTVSVTVNPEAITFSTTADTAGVWTAAPTSDLPNGNHIVIVTAKDGAGNIASSQVDLALNPVAIATTPAPSSGGAAPAPTPAATLAPTGDPVAPITIIALFALIASSFGLWRLSRRYER